MDGCLRSARLCSAPIAEIREGTRPLRLRRGPRFGQRRARRSNSPFERGRPGDDLTSAQPPPDLKRVAERRIPKNPSQKEESWCPDHHHPEKESLKRAHDTRPSAADMSHEKYTNQKCTNWETKNATGLPHVVVPNRLLYALTRCSFITYCHEFRGSRNAQSGYAISACMELPRARWSGGGAVQTKAPAHWPGLLSRCLTRGRQSERVLRWI